MVVDLRCVNCGSGVSKLFVQYSPGNIRLMKCESCKAVADPYIECEFMGIMWKSSLLYFLLDAYRISILKRSKDDWDSSSRLFLSIWICGKVLVDIILGNFMFMSVFLLGIRVLLKSTFGISRFKELVVAILVSSYFQLFLLATMVWEFPSSMIFIADIFVLSSNAVALGVLTQARTSRCVGVCFSAHFAKFFAVHCLPSLLAH